MIAEGRCCYSQCAQLPSPPNQGKSETETAAAEVAVAAASAAVATAAEGLPSIPFRVKMAKLFKSLVLVAAVVGLATAAPSETIDAPMKMTLVQATSPEVVAAAANPRVFAALVAAYPEPEQDSPRALAGFCEGYVDLYEPECHLCNHSGCGFFQCSAFTWYDACKEGWAVCGSRECVGGLCSRKPTCGRKPVSGLRGE